VLLWTNAEEPRNINISYVTNLLIMTLTSADLKYENNNKLTLILTSIFSIFVLSASQLLDDLGILLSLIAINSLAGK